MANKKADNARYRARHRDRILKKQRDWYATPLGRIQTALHKSKRNAKLGGYAPCDSTVEELLATVTSVCQICGQNEQSLPNKLHLDHDHSTGKFRGWICRRCNSGLGMFQDSPTILNSAVKYLGA